MKTYAVSLEKGGTGKSSISVNLAAAFRAAGKRVLLIDLDAQAHATRWLGITPSPEHSILSVVRGRRLEDCVVEAGEEISVLGAHSEMAGLPMALASAPNAGLFVLRNALAEHATRGHAYDVVICDLPPARSPILATALAAATRCIAPVQPEKLVMQALADLSDSVQHARQVNPVLPSVSVLRNRYAVRSAVDTVHDETLRTRYADNLLSTVIPLRASIRESASFQQTVFRYSGGDVSEVRALFRQLANELASLDARS